MTSTDDDYGQHPSFCFTFRNFQANLKLSQVIYIIRFGNTKKKSGNLIYMLGHVLIKIVNYLDFS